MNDDQALDRNHTARQDISDVLIRYASGIDRRDWDLFRSCFTADCTADYGDVGTFEGVEALTAFMIESHATMGHTLHRISNVAVDIEGDRATSRCYYDAALLDPDGLTGLNPVGFYDDDLVLDGGIWRIEHRKVTIATFQLID